MANILDSYDRVVETLGEGQDIAKLGGYFLLRSALCRERGSSRQDGGFDSQWAWLWSYAVVRWRWLCVWHGKRLR